MKYTAAGIVSSLAALLLKRYHPEFSFLLTAAALAVFLLGCTGLVKSLESDMQSIRQMMGTSASCLQPMLKCLGISAVTKIGAGLCRDSAQSSLASGLETVGVLCALLTVMPTIVAALRIIGGML